MQVFQPGMGNNQSNHSPHIPEKVTWSLNTIINDKSQTLLSDFLRGGAAVHRLSIVRHAVKELLLTEH